MGEPDRQCMTIGETGLIAMTRCSRSIRFARSPVRSKGLRRSWGIPSTLLACLDIQIYEGEPFLPGRLDLGPQWLAMGGNGIYFLHGSL